MVGFTGRVWETRRLALFVVSLGVWYVGKMSWDSSLASSGASVRSSELRRLPPGERVSSWETRVFPGVSVILWVLAALLVSVVLEYVVLAAEGERCRMLGWYFELSRVGC